MRRTPYLLLVAMTLMLSATTSSCSREDDPEEQKKEQEDKKVEDWENEDINGDATMAPGVMQFCVGRLSTRAITPFTGEDYIFSVGDRITIELTRGTEVVGTKVYKVSNTDGDLEFDYTYAPTGQPFYLENKNDFQLRAWSYGNSTAVPDDPVGTSFTLNTNQQTGTNIDNYKELLYSPKQTYSYSSNKIPIRLYHQMARLKITLTHEASGDLSVNYVLIGNSSIPTTANFIETGINVASSDFTGSWTGHSSTKTQVYARADVANQNYSAVLFPNTSLSGKLINVVTTDSKTYAYTLPSNVTLNPGNQYNYSITVKDGYKMKSGDYIRYNPLWYVAQYNMASNTAFETYHFTGSPYGMVWDQESAINTFTSVTIGGLSYHLPSGGEQRSIIAHYTAANGGYWSYSGNYTETGVCVAKAPTSILPDFYSVWSGTTTEGNDGWKYGIRYVSTNSSVNQYCSAWRYKWMDSPMCGVQIESYVLDKTITTLEEANAILPELPNSPVWSGTANLSCTSAPSNSSLVMRFIPACGSMNHSFTSPARANSRQNVQCYYWASTESAIWEATAAFVTSYLGAGLSNGRSVRLFRN